MYRCKKFNFSYILTTLCFCIKPYLCFRHPLGPRPAPTARGDLPFNRRRLKLKCRGQDPDILIQPVLLAAHVPKVLRVVEYVRAGLLHGLVRLADEDAHVVVVAGAELGVARPQLPLLRVRVHAQVVIPDVVLRQADVNVKCDVVLGARDEGLDSGCRAYETGLVVGVGCISR